MDENIIQISNLTKVYRIYDKPIDRLKESISMSKKSYSKDFFALNDVSFSIKKGENIGIIGTNGSGKSTLLKIITGVLTQTSGEVEVKGKISALLELGAGFNPEYTGIENIYLNGTMMGFTKQEMDKKIESIVNFADIGDFVNQPVKTYSSGMFARLAFAVAINVEPDILIVDEALSVGDMRFQLKCMKKMKDMMSSGTTVLFVSHDINAIKRFCTSAIWLNNGDCLASGDVDSITDKYLDFLKLGELTQEEIIDENNNENNIKSKEDLEKNIPFVHGENIAEIIAFYFQNAKGEEVDEIELNEPISIEVVYDVYDTNIPEPVLGIALYSIDSEYICGLNTLLDDVKIPWNYGRNRMWLNYNFGVLVLGGKYYLETALEDETATVDIFRKTKIKEFSIKTKYIGEGKVIIPHEWRC